MLTFYFGSYKIIKTLNIVKFNHSQKIFLIHKREVIKTKKENGVRKLLTKSLVGIPVGVTLLIIVYISVYLIAGEAVFTDEISQLHNIDILVSQVASVGLAGYVLFIFFYIISDLQDKEFADKFMTKHPQESALIIVLSFMLLFATSFATLMNEEIFSQNIITLNIVTLVLILSLGGLIFCIKKSREQRLIKENNQKIQEKNKK